jgi:cytochrome c oxidase subunit 2
VAVAEGILLIGFSIPLWAKRVEDFPPREQSVVVRVVGEQFAWNIHYPGPDGKFGKTDIAKLDLQTNPLGLDRTDPDAKDDVVTLNQLHLPVNKPSSSTSPARTSSTRSTSRSSASSRTRFPASRSRCGSCRP